MKKSLLLAAGFLLLCAAFIPAPLLLAQHQYPQGDFTLTGGKVRIPGEEDVFTRI